MLSGSEDVEKQVAKRYCRKMRCSCYRYTYVVFWLLGAWITCMAFYRNYIRYTSYETVTTRKDFPATHKTHKVTFPIIIICSESMHDVTKLKREYPMLNESLLDYFYGDQSLSPDLKLASELDKINVRQFFYSTRPQYKLLMCQYGKYYCGNDWEFIGTVQGNCLKLDLNHIPNFNPHETLLLSLHMQQDEYSTGWSKSPGFSLFTTNIGEETILLPHHAIRFAKKS